MITYFEIGKQFYNVFNDEKVALLVQQLSWSHCLILLPIKDFKKINHDKTIGIIICKQDNYYVIKYCSDERIIAREYELV